MSLAVPLGGAVWSSSGGSYPEAGLDALAAQAKKGIVCVRSTRVVTGRVGRDVEVDDEPRLGASDDSNPQKARVPPGLALLKPRRRADVQRLLVGY